MIQWVKTASVYLHRDPVDFRKAINGLAVIVSEHMELSLLDSAIFVFCNKRRDQLKVLYWDQTGFTLWQKRLEKDKFKWPRKHSAATITLTHEQWLRLLRGFDITKLNPHNTIRFSDVS